jgi:hypothetical protein
VRIERIVADETLYCENVAGAAVSNLRLPSRIRDLRIDYTALSLVAPEKVLFKYKLDGQGSDWREVVDDRQVQFSHLSVLARHSYSTICERVDCTPQTVST